MMDKTSAANHSCSSELLHTAAGEKHAMHVMCRRSIFDVNRPKLQRLLWRSDVR